MHEPREGWGDGEKELESIVVKKFPRWLKDFSFSRLTGSSQLLRKCSYWDSV